MSFLEHLDELRRRILYALYAVLATCAVTFAFAGVLYREMLAYFAANGGSFIYTHATEGFVFYLKITLLAAVLVASPFVFTQVWLFVSPGLYTREKRLAIPFVMSSTLLFLGGAAFAHFVAFPAMWRFFASFEADGVLSFMPTIREAFSFYVKIILAMGLIFQMPMLVLFLARLGLVSARLLIVKTKYAVLGIFIVAAVVTPSGDIVTQSLFAAPMLVLYVISIGVAWLFGRPRPAA